MKQICGNAEEMLAHVGGIEAVTPHQLIAVRLPEGVGTVEYEAQDPKIMLRSSDTEIEVRMRMQLESAAARLVADIGISYSLTKPIAPSESALKEFVERVAVMALFPYVRESLHTSAARLGVDPPVLGIIRAGELTLDALVRGAEESDSLDERTSDS